VALAIAIALAIVAILGVQRIRVDDSLSQLFRSSSPEFFGGRTPFNAVDRSALFVRPIDSRREAALAQAG
jgi:hypothetical protein